MKKLFLTALLFLALASGAFAAPERVHAAILENFKTKFQKATDVSWSAKYEYTKASFIAENAKMEVFYNGAGDIVATSRSISLDELPTAAKRSFAKKFEGYQVKEAIRLEGFDEVSYYISGENAKEEVILKVNENNQVSQFSRTKNSK